MEIQMDSDDAKSGISAEVPPKQEDPSAAAAGRPKVEAAETRQSEKTQEWPEFPNSEGGSPRADGSPLGTSPRGDLISPWRS